MLQLWRRRVCKLLYANDAFLTIFSRHNKADCTQPPVLFRGEPKFDYGNAPNLSAQDAWDAIMEADDRGDVSDFKMVRLLC